MKHDPQRRRHHRTVPLPGLVALTGAGYNYARPDGPRFAGGPGTPPTPGPDAPAAPAAPGETAATTPAAISTAGAAALRVVTYNIEFARRVDGAIGVLAGAPALRDADVVLLQEMTAEATRRVADALGLWYVYYPAIVHGRTRQQFGNAVLSRRPIVDDAKLVLPHRSRVAGTQRTATAATIRVGATPVRVYSVHLGTVLDVGGGARRAQLETVLADAASHGRVVIGGDLNSGRVGRVARAGGYHWPTERLPWTTAVGRLDHIFLRGLRVPPRGAAGTVREGPRASDHRPVWAVGVVE